MQSKKEAIKSIKTSIEESIQTNSIVELRLYGDFGPAILDFLGEDGVDYGFAKIGWEFDWERPSDDHKMPVYDVYSIKGEEWRLKLKFVIIYKGEEEVLYLMANKEMLSIKQVKLLDSFHHFALKYGSLSYSQLDRVMDWKSRVELWKSPPCVLLQEEWEKSGFDEGKRKKALIASRYYKRLAKNKFSVGYYVALADKVMSGEPINMKQYFSLAMNKYSSRVVEETLKEPKYPVGTIAQFRKKWIDEVKYMFSEDKLVEIKCFVLETDHTPCWSYAKGCKVYRVLPFNSQSPIDCEERDLKFVKRGKKCQK